jgi:poly(3-hydroxyalkanoate) synthetase
MAEVFAWLRPNDLIWSYWVNNYLLGKPPKAFDILYWNADPVRMTAALHRDFIELAVSNGLTVPGGSTMLGSPVDLGKVDTDAYVVAGIADHLCKWESCYRTTQLMGGGSRFVLSTSGHIASMVNPPGNEKASFQTADRNPEDPAEWLESATTVKGSWWDDYVDWLSARTGPERARPRRLGSVAFEPVGPAPGTYVHDR